MLSVCLSIYVSVCLSICLSVRACVHNLITPAPSMCSDNSNQPLRIDQLPGAEGYKHKIKSGVA